MSPSEETNWIRRKLYEDKHKMISPKKNGVKNVHRRRPALFSAAQAGSAPRWRPRFIP